MVTGPLKLRVTQRLWLIPFRLEARFLSLVATNLILPIGNFLVEQLNRIHISLIKKDRKKKVHSLLGR